MPTQALIAALIAVESGGNDFVVGDGGRAIGALQIHKAVVEDVNRIAGTHYSHAGMTNRADAVKVFEIYIGHWATASRVGHSVTDEDRARIWNGGPNGHRKTATLGYAEKVKGILCLTTMKGTNSTSSSTNSARTR